MLGRRRRTRGIAPLLLALGLTGCGGSGPHVSPMAPSTVSPVAPSPVAAAPVQLVVFTDPATGLSTADVRDFQEQIVRFDTGSGLTWVTDQTRFTGYRVVGDKIRGPGPNDAFQVRFGTQDGERRAYLGWDDDWCHCPGTPPVIADVEVREGRLVITPSTRLVPGF